MTGRTLDAPREACRQDAIRDAGVSLIEVLISIVLLGIGVASMLTLLTVTIQASATERDHANAHAWLQSATDVLYGLPRADCNDNPGKVTDEPAVFAAYEPAIKGTANPEQWDASNIEIVRPILFWNGDIYQSQCFDDRFQNLQLIKLRVTNPSGQIVETVEVVKG